MIVLSPFRLAPRAFAAAASIALLAASLSACGRRGPLELPPEVQARGQQLQAEAQTHRPPVVGPLGEPINAPPPPIPGTIGNRPPAEYPFLLDPLL